MEAVMTERLNLPEPIAAYFGCRQTRQRGHRGVLHERRRGEG